MRARGAVLIIALIFNPLAAMAQDDVKDSDKKDQCLIVDMDWKAIVDNLLKELRTDFPFKAGMTIEEVNRLYAANNEKVRALEKEYREKQKKSGDFRPPIFADKDKHLYVYVDLAESDQTARRFWVNGRSQFWVAMALDNGKVKNIYVTPGNLSGVLSPVLFDGEGEDVGVFSKESTPEE